ncbi:hypothetical protein TSTA_105650 [Talaromyces stipitatus ATCC 10500]|uniref:Bacteriophage T5 Orf172 DNA-binding domain-containing protein n=1 Tax=Talaromyces stipitatus (strain ATCC 10500 / CBS 375.48 / QM 6759 / NRRL 1006) TaxID=441959 RepID=B8MPB5_TALSN|nr:uncharacterized protein TSTA_105650 [Talaromyces stipitatus ATCC 10500]EED14354.1 hypothetical protein TSTA_105650 [Talaromyces stipitatus ATCC 10500]
MPLQTTTPSKCTYIIHKGKPEAKECGKKPKSGSLCAEHKLRKPQVHDSDEGEREEETRPAERSIIQERRTRESTPVTDTPTRPRTARNKSSSTSATNTPISTDRKSTPRPCTRDSTPKATPKSASTRKSRSSLPRADSTPPTLTRTSSDGIEELTGRLKDLNVEDEDDIEAIPSVREWPVMPKRVDTAESVVSYGTCDPYKRALSNYLMEGIKDVLVAAEIIKELPKFPRSDGPGYVYIFRATPVQSFQMTTDNKKSDVPRRHQQKTFKAERMAHIQLQIWPYEPPNGRCLCGTKHKELFAVTPKQLKAVFKCVDHWATVVNTDHEKLWPGAVEMNSSKTDGQSASRLTASSRS